MPGGPLLFVEEATPYMPPDRALQKTDLEIEGVKLKAPLFAVGDDLLSKEKFLLEAH